MFDLIGETLRRLRKERGLTLEELRSAARLGRGQLSRIENSKQEATLSTLAKILDGQGVSRREFFRRYDLVESEAVALERYEAGDPATEEDWPKEVRDVLSKGSIEIGDLVVLFRVVPKDRAAAQGEADGEPLKPQAPKTRAGKTDRSGSSGRKRKR